MLDQNLWLILMGKKKNEFAIWWIKKNVIFTNPPILNIFSPKFQGLILGRIEQIDAKGSDVAQSIHSINLFSWIYQIHFFFHPH